MSFRQLELFLATMPKQDREFLLILILSQTAALIRLRTITVTVTTIRKILNTKLVFLVNTTAIPHAVLCLALLMSNTLQQKSQRDASRISVT